jgi:hypothetical protein
MPSLLRVRSNRKLPAASEEPDQPEPSLRLTWASLLRSMADLAGTEKEPCGKAHSQLLAIKAHIACSEATPTTTLGTEQLVMYDHPPTPLNPT